MSTCKDQPSCRCNADLLKINNLPRRPHSLCILFSSVFSAAHRDRRETAGADRVQRKTRYALRRCFWVPCAAQLQTTVPARDLARCCVHASDFPFVQNVLHQSLSAWKRTAFACAVTLLFSLRSSAMFRTLCGRLCVFICVARLDVGLRVVPLF